MMIVVTDSEKRQPRLRLTVSIQQVLKILRSPMQSRVDQTLAASLPRWRQQPVTWAHKKQKRASVALATGRQFYSDFNRSSVRAAVKETLTKPQSNPAVIISASVVEEKLQCGQEAASNGERETAWSMQQFAKREYAKIIRLLQCIALLFIPQRLSMQNSQPFQTCCSQSWGTVAGAESMVLMRLWIQIINILWQSEPQRKAEHKQSFMMSTSQSQCVQTAWMEFILLLCDAMKLSIVIKFLKLKVNL